MVTLGIPKINRVPINVVRLGSDLKHVGGLETSFGKLCKWFGMYDIMIAITDDF